MRKLLCAAVVALGLAAVTVAVAVISHHRNAASSVAGTAEGQGGTSGVPPSKLPSKRPTQTPASTPTTRSMAKPTGAPDPTSTKRPTTSTTVPVLRVPDSTEAGPAVAGPCRGVVIKPGQDPQAVINAHPAGSTTGTSLWDGGGINVNTSTNVRIRNNTVSGNVNGISIQSRTRGDGPWGRYLLRNAQVTGNLVAMTGGTQSTGVVQNAGADVPAGALTFTGNRYLLDNLAAQRFARFGAKLTADGWRGAGLDTASSFKAG